MRITGEDVYTKLIGLRDACGTQGQVCRSSDPLQELNVAVKLSKKSNYKETMKDGGILPEDMREIAFLQEF